MTNICLVTLLLYPCNIGGLELFNYYLIKSLSKKYNLNIITSCKKLNKINLLLINDEDLKLIYPKVLLNLIKLRKDLIIFPYTSNSPIIYPLLFINLIFKTKYIIIIHGGGLYPWKPFFFQNLFFKRSNKIIAVSNPIKIEYEKRSNRKITLIPPLIPFIKSDNSKEDIRSIYGFSGKDKIILSLGSIKKIKGNDILLEAFMNLELDLINKNNLKLLFVGDGPLKKNLEQKISNNNFEKLVKFTGAIPHNKVKEFYKMADIYVIPSLFEGTPISLLEAMYNALPIIGSDVSGINNIIEDEVNGLLFDVGKSSDLTLKIKKLISNHQKCIKLGDNAKKYYSINYNYNNMIKEYEKIFFECGVNHE